MGTSGLIERQASSDGNPEPGGYEEWADPTVKRVASTAVVYILK